MASDHLADLRTAIADGRAVIVAGAGVSRGASGEDVALWTGLLRHGVRWCADRLRDELPAGWADPRLAMLDEGRLGSHLSVAQELTDSLQRGHSRAFANWLGETVGALEPKDPELIEELVALGLPLLTTNYDDLLERVTGRPAVTWLDRRAVERARGIVEKPERGILHLHGHVDDPDSIVLGVRSYGELARREDAQFFQKAAGFFHSFVFVGCGAGLGDPNLRPLLDWLRDHFSGRDHYLIASDDEIADLELRYVHDPIHPIPCGGGHETLPELLRGLRPPRYEPVSPPADPFEAAIATWRSEALEAGEAVTMVGLGARELELPLEEVYVRLSFAEEPRKSSSDRAAVLQAPRGEAFEVEAYADRELELPDLLAAAERRDRRHALVLGDPGSGKTTGLRKLRRICLGGGGGTQRLGLPSGSVPVFLRLRHLREGQLADRLWEVAERGLRAGEAGAALPPDAGRRLWEDGRLLFLLDGLDEVANARRRAALCRWLVRELRDAPPGVRAVVSSRRSGYDGETRPGQEADEHRVSLPADSFLHLTVRPLTGDQVQALTRRWFDAAKALHPAQADRLEEAAEGLLAALDGEEFASQRLKTMVSNPLLLTLLCIVGYRGGVLPKARTDFYRRCLEVVLGSWVKEEREVEPPLAPEEALEVLRPIAWELHREGDELPANELVAGLADGLRALGSDLPPLDFLAWLREQAGLVEEFGENRLGYFHLGVQEYLTALHATAEGGAVLDELCDAALDPERQDRWREVVLLAAGLPHRRVFEPLVAELLARGALLEEPDLLSDVLAEAAAGDVAAPFVERLRRGSEAEQRAVLRLFLAGRRCSEALLEAARELVMVGGGELAALAEQLVANERRVRRGEAPPPERLLVVTAGVGEADGDSGRGAALAERLKGLGWCAEVFGVEACEGLWTEIGDVGGVVVVEESDEAPWTERPVVGLMRLAWSMDVPVVAVTCGGGTSPRDWPNAEGAGGRGPTFVDGEPLGEEVALAVVGSLLEESPQQEEPRRGRGELLSRGEPPGEVSLFTDATTGMRFLSVPGGRLLMGDEGIACPVRPVDITGFWLGETPVTNEEYGLYLDSVEQSNEPQYWRDGRFSDPQQPVVGVSWEEAKAFCAWLTEAGGLPPGWVADLPSEAQWEWAAKSSDGRVYPWGDKEPDETRGHFGGESLLPTRRASRWRDNVPVAVGAFPSGRGPFGHLDLAGNVGEWCCDFWDPEAYEKPAGEDPVVEEAPYHGRAFLARPPKDDERVIRGGGWFDPGKNVQCAARNYGTQSDRHAGVGFRVAVVRNDLPK